MILSYHFNPPNTREGVGIVASAILEEIKADWQVLYLPFSLKKLFYYTGLSAFWFAYKAFQLKPKIVVVHTLEASFDPVLARFLLAPFGINYKIYTIAHGTNKGVLQQYKKELQTPYLKPSFSFQLNNFISLIRGRAVIFSDKVFAVSNLVKKELKKYYNKDSIIMHNALSSNFLQKAKKRKRTKLNTILFLGNSYWIKGLPYLIKANAFLKKPKTLVIAGLGKGQESLIKSFFPNQPLIFKYPKTRLALHQLFNKADLFCMPSVYESFGIAYLEALAHSLPCIGSKETGAEEIIQNNKNGFLVEKRHPKLLAIAIQKAEKQISKLNKNSKIEKKFLWKNSLKPLKEILERNL